MFQVEIKLHNNDNTIIEWHDCDTFAYFPPVSCCFVNKREARSSCSNHPRYITLASGNEGSLFRKVPMTLVEKLLTRETKRRSRMPYNRAIPPNERGIKYKAGALEPLFVGSRSCF